MNEDLNTETGRRRPRHAADVSADEYVPPPVTASAVSYPIVPLPPPKSWWQRLFTWLRELWMA